MFKFRRIKRCISILKWLWSGCGMLMYKGFTCGCCGKYWNEPFVVSAFDSCGEWWDTWGVCSKGKGCNKEK